MINPEEILTIIPARGGSKGVPRKNIRELGGKPLIAYTIEVALSSKYINRLIVSTDDEEIADISQKWGADVPFIRPQELANDTAKAIDVVQHALKEMEKLDKCEYSTIVYLEPPSPFRCVEDIDICIESFYDNTVSSVVSVYEANHFHPMSIKKIEGGFLKPFYKDIPEGTPRQLFSPKAYVLNGAVYVIKNNNIMAGIFYGDRIFPYIMPNERSICIDTMMDWYSAEEILNYNLSNK